MMASVGTTKEEEIVTLVTHCLPRCLMTISGHASLLVHICSFSRLANEPEFWLIKLS